MALSPMACKVYFGFHSNSNPWIFLRLFLLSEIFRSRLLYGVPVYLRYITLQKASFSQSWPTVQFPLLVLFSKVSETFGVEARSLPSLPMISSLKTSDFSRYSSVLILPDYGLASFIS